MGGRYEVDMCLVIIEEHFGHSAALVVSALFKEPGPLPVIGNRLKGQVNLAMIRRCLVVLEQHGIVKYKLDGLMRTCYSINKSAIYGLTKAARCCLIVKTLYGGIAEAICEELFNQGRLTCSDALRRVAVRLQLPIGEIKEKFCRLAEAQFISRDAPLELSLRGCPQFSSSYDAFIMPDIILQHIAETKDDTTRKRKADDSEEKDGDLGIYWRLNWSRFDRYTRDEMVLDLLVPKANAANQSSHIESLTIRSLLKANEVRSSQPATVSTAPISIVDMMRSVKDNEMGLEKKDLEWSLRCLCEETRNVLRKAGDSGGGLYVIDFERAIHLICQSHIESLITEQLESRAVRIFRLLQNRGYLEEDQIEKLCMMSSKETRELLYAMLEEGYVFVRSVGRTNDFAPARTFSLYHVNMPQTVRGLIEYTCKVLRNLILRRSYETKEHKGLMEKQSKMDAIIETIQTDENMDEETKKQQMDEVRDMYMTSSDRASLDLFKKNQCLLVSAETQTEKVLFAFLLYIEFASRRC